MPDEIDGELLRRFVQGDHDAFEALFRQFDAAGVSRHPRVESGAGAPGYSPVIDDEHLRQLLRSALPLPADQGPAGDLWPRVVRRIETPPAWSWLDMSLAAMVAITLLMFPEGLFLLAYHL